MKRQDKIPFECAPLEGYHIPGCMEDDFSVYKDEVGVYLQLVCMCGERFANVYAKDLNWLSVRTGGR